LGGVSKIWHISQDLVKRGPGLGSPSIGPEIKPLTQRPTGGSLIGEDEVGASGGLVEIGNEIKGKGKKERLKKRIIKCSIRKSPKRGCKEKGTTRLQELAAPRVGSVWGGGQVEGGGGGRTVGVGCSGGEGGVVRGVLSREGRAGGGGGGGGQSKVCVWVQATGPKVAQGEWMRRVG